MVFRIGLHDRSYTAEVCPQAFRNILDLQKSTFNNIIKQLKHGNLNGARKFNDMTKLSEECIQHAQDIILLNADTALPTNDGLTLEQKAYLHLKNSPSQLKAYAYLDSYFNLVGDFQPNATEEIHLDPVEKIEIYREYYKVMTTDDCFENTITYSAFLELWNKCFP